MGQLLFFHCKKAPRGARGWLFPHHYFLPQYAGHILGINKHTKFNQLKLIDGHYLDSEFVKCPFAYSQFRHVVNRGEIFFYGALVFAARVNPTELSSVF